MREKGRREDSPATKPDPAIDATASHIERGPTERGATEHGADKTAGDASTMADSLADAAPTPLVQYRLTQQAILSDFGLEALQSRDLDGLLQKSCALCAQGMQARLAKALRYEAEADVLVVAAGVGWNPGTVGVARVGADLASPAGFALKTGKPVISNHLENEERFRTPALMVEHGVKRAINVLIMANDLPWGVLEVDSPDEGRFEVADIAFMQGFANLLGVAIERHRAEEKLVAAIEHQKLLVRETSHRVKNSLTMVYSLLHLQARSAASDEVTNALDEAAARVVTIAEAHDQLWRTSTSGSIELSTYLCDLCRRLQAQSARVDAVCEAEQLIIDADRAISIGLLVTELVTNAFKYAYPGGDGVVRVALMVGTAELVLSVSDQGVGLPEGFGTGARAGTSLGMKMVRSLTQQLNGQLQVENDGGACFTVRIPRRA